MPTVQTSQAATAVEALSRRARSETMRQVLAGAGLFLAVLVVYRAVWGAGFVWDDNTLLVENPNLPGVLGLWRIWTTTAADICPLTLTTFWCEYKLWGLAPVPYHVVNVLMHGACALVLWRVLRRLQVPGAWIGAALWALHPVQAESVAWITEMKNTESGVFFLLSVLFFLRMLERPDSGAPSRSPARGTVLVIVFAAMAMAAKSSAVVLPIVLCLVAIWREGRWRWRHAWAVGPVFLLALVASGLPIWVQVLMPGAATGTHPARGLAERLAIAGDAIWFYLGKLVWPHPLMAVYPLWQLDTGKWYTLLPLAGAVILLVMLCWSRRLRQTGVLLAFAYFLAALLPVLGLVEMGYFALSFVADHFIYLASMGPLALAGAGLAWVVRCSPGQFKLTLAAVTCALLCLLGLASWERARVFGSTDTLWTDNIAKNPTCLFAYDIMGDDWVKRGRVNEAIALYRSALKINPEHGPTHNSLGNAFATEDRTDEAIIEFQRALEIRPNDAPVCYNLGNALLHQGRLEAAMNEYRHALELQPDYNSARNNLALALGRTGQWAEAVVEYRAVLETEPDAFQAHYNLANALLQNRKVDEAIAEYQAALKLNPGSAQTHYNLGNAFYRKGAESAAAEQYQLALQLEPDKAEIHNNLGNALFHLGHLEDALGQYQEVVRLQPQNAYAYRSIGMVLQGEGRFDEALASFRQAVQLKPDYKEAQADLADAENLAKRLPTGVSIRP